jgi:hypothetical protein
MSIRSSRTGRDEWPALSGGDLSGDLGAVVIAFLVLVVVLAMTFAVYYVLLGG